MYELSRAHSLLFQGSLNVLKRLKKVNAFEGSRLTSPNRKLEQPEVKTAKERKEEKDRVKTDQRFIMSEIKIPKRHPAEIFEIESKSLPQIRLIGLTSTSPAFSLTRPSSEKYIRHKQTVLPSIGESSRIIRCQTQAQVVNSSLELPKTKTRIKSYPSRLPKASVASLTSSPMGAKRLVVKRRSTIPTRGNLSSSSEEEDSKNGKIV
jgi:hypothetical protein